MNGYETCFDDSYFFLPLQKNWIVVNLTSDNGFEVGLLPPCMETESFISSGIVRKQIPLWASTVVRHKLARSAGGYQTLTTETTE